MFKQKVWLVLASLMLGIFSLAAAPSARAVVFVGSWDPQFGLPFTTGAGFPFNLGWRGQITVFIPLSCIPDGPGDISNSVDCDNGASVEGAAVELYDMANPGPTLSTLTFTPASLSVNLLRFDGSGNLIGLTTPGTSDYATDTSSAFPAGAGTGFAFAVQFALDGSPSLFSDNFPSLPTDYSGPVLFALSESCEGDCFFRNSVDEANRPQITFTRVPEPASLLLISGALLGAGIAIRRRRSTRGRRELG